MVKKDQKTVTKDDYGNYSVRRISKNRYHIDSKKSMMTYAVTKTMYSGIWSCQCHDFIARLRRGTDDKRYKHISYLTAILNVEHQIQNSIKIPTEKMLDTCLYCSSTDIVKAGFRKTKRRGDIQLWKCNDCKKRFAGSDSGFARVRIEPSVISEALNMVMSGMSRVLWLNIS